MIGGAFVENELLTVTQTANYLKVCEKTVRRLIGKKTLVASKVGGSWRIQKNDLDCYLKETQNNYKVDNEK